MAGGDTVSLTAFSDAGEQETALKIESKLQMIGIEGSIPEQSAVRDICQTDDPSGPLLSWSHQFTAHQVPEWGQPGGQWQQQLDKPCVHHH